MGNTEADGVNGNLRNTTIAVPLKYLSKFCRSHKTPLTRCKIELKIKWTKHFVSSAAANDNDDANLNNISFTIKDAKFYLCCVVFLSAKDNQKLSKLFSKWFERKCIGINVKQKVRIKMQRKSIDSFLNQNL